MPGVLRSWCRAVTLVHRRPNVGKRPPLETSLALQMNERRAPRPTLLALLAAVLVLVAYSPTIGAPFMWDDHHLVLGSTFVRETSTFSDFFNTAFFSQQETEPQGRGYYRPLTILSLALDHAIHATNAGGYHLTNLVLHVVNALLLLSLLRKAGASPLAAAVGATLWALAPRLTEAVAWVSGRTDVLAGTFVLLALLVAERASWPRRALAALLLLGGLLSKEVALAGVAAVAVIELSRPVRFRARLLALAPLSLSLLAYACFRVHAIGVVPHGSGASLVRRLSAAPEALGRYLVALLDPWHPNVQIGHLLAPSTGYIVLGVAVLIASVVCAPRMLRAARHPLERAGLTLVLVGFLLVLHLLPLAVDIVAADRFLYLPLAGILLVATRPASELLARIPLLVRAGMPALLVASFGVVTWQRSLLWSDEIDFWSDAYSAGKINSAPAVELGNVYYRAGLHRQAIAIYQSRPSPMGYSNTAAALQAIGRYEQARYVMAKLVRTYPAIPKFHLNLALAALSVDDFEMARREIDEALRHYPGYQVALAMRKQLPKLAAGRQQPTGNTTNELFESATRALDYARTLDAVRLFEAAMSHGKMTRSQARDAFFLAMKFAEPKATERIFEGYAAAYDGDPPGPLVEAYRLRRESGKRLLALFPSFKLPLPEL
jgi:tetratricopeptide (TPR) repeat protein